MNKSNRSQVSSPRSVGMTDSTLWSQLTRLVALLKDAVQLFPDPNPSVDLKLAFICKQSPRSADTFASALSD
jgi:hypothetical protein